MENGKFKLMKKRSPSLLLDSVVGGTFWHNLWLFAGQSSVIDNLALSAGDKTRIAINAGDESSTVSNGESGVGPELVGQGSGLNLIGTTETDDLFWVTLFQEEIRPVAGVGLVIVGESRLTWGLVWNSVGALDVRGMAGVGLWIESELVKTSWGGDGGDVSQTVVAMNGPVVIAVIMDSSFSIEHQPILTSLKGQSSVLAFVELIAVFGVTVNSQAISVWAWWSSDEGVFNASNTMDQPNSHDDGHEGCPTSHVLFVL